MMTWTPPSQQKDLNCRSAVHLGRKVQLKQPCWAKDSMILHKSCARCPTMQGRSCCDNASLCFFGILCTSACLEALNGAWQHADASPSAPLLFEALLRWLACLPEEDGTNGAACTAGFAEAGAGLSPSPCGGTNGFAENVKPFPLGLACPLAFASDITGHHTGDMTRSAHCREF